MANIPTWLSRFSLLRLPSRFLGIQPVGFGYVGISDDKLHVSVNQSGKHKHYFIQLNDPSSELEVKHKLVEVFRKHKLVAAGLSEDKVLQRIAPSLWLDEDVVSLILSGKHDGEKSAAEEKIKNVAANFDTNNIAHVHILPDNEVKITDLVAAEDYQKISSEAEWRELKQIADKLDGRKISFISATPQGGGVALMRHAMIRLCRLINLNVHWYVLEPDENAFVITKRKFHNVLQAVSDPQTRLTDEDKDIYDQWISRNAKLLWPVFQSSEVIIIDDPQPAGLIPYIRQANPSIKIIYRSHIQIEARLADQEGTPQHQVWSFLWNKIQSVDLFVSHPVPEFVPSVVPRNKLVFMGAVTDPLDGLNKPLSDRQMAHYLQMFNAFLKRIGQKPLDLRRDYLIQIARFDPSKGIPDVLESYYKLCQKLIEKGKGFPQLVITGNGSIDDPDRGPIYSQTMEVVNSEKFRRLKSSIKVIPLPHIDQLLNAILRGSKIVLQLSTKEGFEIKVTEALMKGKPVVAYRTGGIPLQIKDKVNGYLVEKGDTDQVANILYELINDDFLYQRVSHAAEVDYDKSLNTVSNMLKWSELCLGLIGLNK